MISETAQRQPLLSILMPAYNFPEGIERAIESMSSILQSNEIELVVLDDSSDIEQAKKIERLTEKYHTANYRRNVPPLGAAKNWNALLKKARGVYCLILHHDEYFESPSIILELLQQLRKSNEPDCVVLTCALAVAGKPLRKHMPNLPSRWVLNHWPTYLIRRNMIGSPSVFVLRRSLYEAYDERLRWYLDVELYVRILNRSKLRITILPTIGIISDQSFSGSITKNIVNELPAIRRQEAALLKASGTFAKNWGWIVDPGPASMGLRAIETTAWCVFRVGWSVSQNILEFNSFRRVLKHFRF